MSYKNENTKLLQTILDASFFKPWSSEKYTQSIEKRDLAIELYVTSTCDQKCEYCYLYKYEDALYPPHLRDKATILKNLSILIDYLIEKEYNFNRMDIFSGEILHTSFGLEILEKIYQGKVRGLKVNDIQYPTNCSFLLSEEATAKVQAQFDKLKSVGVSVRPSASVDGLILDADARSFKDGSKNSKRDQAFYDRLFDFILKNDGGFHPMLSAYSIEKWKDNLVWWGEQCKKYNISLVNSVMTLEVRNDEWTPAKIKAYSDFLQFYGDWIFENECDNNRRVFAEMMFNLVPEHSTRGYHNLHLFNDTQIATCSVSQQLTIRLGDLAICPCHRTSYPEFLYGQFKIENDKIVGIEGNNPFVAAKILMMNQRVCHHGCDTCWNKNCCIRQCFGSQFESGQDLFMPIESVCNMLKEKTLTIDKVYKKYGVIDELKQILEDINPADQSMRNKIETNLGLYEELIASLNKHGEVLPDESCE